MLILFIYFDVFDLIWFFFKANNVEFISANPKSNQIPANMAAEIVLAKQVDVRPGANLHGTVVYGGL